ncbi:hypothetical protein M0813_15080 [Anaeramoeba flamelloides]|uniref:Uncharacterized protein n=1 Tax=Anaeramoeba flamelloides TaxID=1746091 RepID=A0ABQ8Z3F9_9EUKA|nr:hypothetical protein M0813_15080 [Anaeramoeba flamelloides]
MSNKPKKNHHKSPKVNKKKKSVKELTLYDLVSKPSEFLTKYNNDLKKQLDNLEKNDPKEEPHNLLNDALKALKKKK